MSDLDRLTVDELRRIPIKRLARELELYYAGLDYYPKHESQTVALLLRLVDLLEDDRRRRQ